MPAYSTVATIVMVAAIVIPANVLALGSEFGSATTIAAAQLSPGSGVARPIQSGTSGIGRGSKGGTHPGKGGGSIDDTISPHSTR
jgi:hypothetical protein